jgi:superfamily II DNA or RNA helicase
MTIDAASTPPVPLRPELLRDLLSAFPLFTTQTRARGVDYAESGRVLTYDAGDGRIHSKVMGTQAYETEWQWYDGEWDCACSCPVEVYCKHAYAVALRVLADAAAAGFEDPRLRDVLPGAVDAEPSDGEDDDEDDWDQDESAIVTLREGRQLWQRESALDRLLQNSPVLVSPYAPGFAEIMEEPDPDILCWRLAQRISRETGGWLPDELASFGHRDDLAAIYSSRERDSLADQLLEWVGQRRAIPRRRLRLGFVLAPATGISAQVLFEVQLTTARLSRAARSAQQLQQIRAEQRREPLSLLPEHAALLEWISANANAAPSAERFQTARLSSLLDWVADNPELAVWASDVDETLARRAGIEPGAPLRIGRSPLRVVPRVLPRGDKLAVALAVAWPDGRERSLDEGVLFVEPVEAVRGLVLCDGEFHALSEAPPVELLSGFAEVGELVLDTAARARALNVLSSRFPTVAQALADRTRIHAAQAVIAFDLREDDWLHARVFACRKVDDWQPGQPVSAAVAAFEWSSDAGWIPLEADVAPDAASGYGAVAGAGGEPAEDRPVVVDAAPSVAPAENVWLEIPDPADVAPALEWLENVPMRSRAMVPDAPASSDDDGWWMPATQRRMNDLAEAWQERPRSVRFVGTERVRRLLGGSRRVRPRVRVRRSGIDWFAVSAELEADGQDLTPEQVDLLRRSPTRFVKLGSDWVSKDAIASFDQANALLADLGLDASGEEQRLSLWQLIGAAPETLAGLEAMDADDETLAAVQELREKIESFAGIPEVEPPGELAGVLRDYQKRGLDFLVHASSLDLGPVLADDMGLGKTLQALAWVQHQIVESPGDGPVLVVCPASVVHVWKREAERFTPDLRVLILARGRERFEQWDEIAQSDLVVTNYALLRRDVARWREVRLRAFILDEAQSIKNPDTAVARAARSLKARRRLALTGTPLENRPLDVWSIVACLNPGYLGGRTEFQDRFGNPENPASAYKLLSAKLRPILLRRTKDQVAPELPERIEQRLECDLTPGQRQLYMAELHHSRQRVFDLADDDPDLRRNRVAVLAVLTRLRQICCHPALVGADAGLGSGKFEIVFALLESLLAEGHKVLLFSQFVRCLNLLEAELTARDMRYHLLTGSTRNRQEVVETFQEEPDPSVFLISLKAGGTGLNLTSASYVVLFDPWWNPAVEAQAIDRTHRIGQSRTVFAYRMTTRGTIEEKIWELQQRKAKMLSDVLSEQSFAGSLTKDDLSFILQDPE